MKDILGTHFEIVKTDILNYLSTNKDHFTDRRVLKSIKFFILDDSDEPSLYRQKQALRRQILESEERYDLKWLSVLLIDLIGEDYQDVAYTLKKINYDKFPNEIVGKLDLLKRVARLVYLYDGDNILDVLENLMQHPASDSISTAEILWTQYYYYDSEEIDYELLVNMVKIILKHRETEYSSYFFMGFLFVEQELFPLALNSYLKALDICRSNSALYEQLSWLYMRVADCQYNMKWYKDVLESTDHALLYYNKYNTGNANDISFYHFIFKIRCRAYYSLGLYQKSLDDAIKALEYCPQENREAMIGLKEVIEKRC